MPEGDSKSTKAAKFAKFLKNGANRRSANQWRPVASGSEVEACRAKRTRKRKLQLPVVPPEIGGCDDKQVDFIERSERHKNTVDLTVTCREILDGILTKIIDESRAALQKESVVFDGKDSDLEDGEILDEESNEGSKPCQFFWQRGFCALGNQCDFVHNACNTTKAKTKITKTNNYRFFHNAKTRHQNEQPATTRSSVWEKGIMEAKQRMQQATHRWQQEKSDDHLQVHMQPFSKQNNGTSFDVPASARTKFDRYGNVLRYSSGSDVKQCYETFSPAISGEAHHKDVTKSCQLPVHRQPHMREERRWQTERWNPRPHPIACQPYPQVPQRRPRVEHQRQKQMQADREFGKLHVKEARHDTWRQTRRGSRRRSVSPRSSSTSTLPSRTSSSSARISSTTRPTSRTSFKSSSSSFDTTISMSSRQLVSTRKDVEKQADIDAWHAPQAKPLSTPADGMSQPRQSVPQKMKAGKNVEIVDHLPRNTTANGKSDTFLYLKKNSRPNIRRRQPSSSSSSSSSSSTSSASSYSNISTQSSYSSHTSRSLHKSSSRSISRNFSQSSKNSGSSCRSSRFSRSRSTSWSSSEGSIDKSVMEVQKEPEEISASSVAAENTTQEKLTSDQRQMLMKKIQHIDNLLQQKRGEKGE